MTDDIQSERLYTVSQTVVATLLGGPLAGAILLAQNYKQLDELKHARRAVIYGAVSVVVLFPITLFWPDRVPSVALPVGYTVAFRARQNVSRVRRSNPDWKRVLNVTRGGG